MRFFDSILAVAAVATAQNVCNGDGTTTPASGTSPAVPPCGFYMPAQKVPSTGSVANGYRSAKATIKNQEWGVFNLDFKDITNVANTFPAAGWSQWIGVKVEKSNTGGLKNLFFAWDGVGVTQKYDSLWDSGADWLGPYQPSSGSVTTNVKSEAFFCYPVSVGLTGLKVAVQADCANAVTNCALGSDYRVTPFTYYARNKWSTLMSSSGGVMPLAGSSQANRGLEWKTGGSSLTVGADALAIVDGTEGTSGWTMCPQAMNAGMVESRMYLQYDVNEFQPEFIWRWPVQTEAFTATFNTQLFFQQTYRGNNDDVNRWFNAPASSSGVANPADVLRTAFMEVTAGQNDALGFAGQTVYIKRQSNENGLNLFAEVTGDVAFLASGKASLCFTSQARASTTGFPGRSNSATYYGLQPVGYAAERKTTCDLGCYPNADCKFAGLKVGGMSMGNFLISEPAGTGIYATVIIADTQKSGGLYSVGHQVAFAFGHAPNSASSVGLSAAAVLLMAAAVML